MQGLQGYFPATKNIFFFSIFLIFLYGKQPLQPLLNYSKKLPYNTFYDAGVEQTPAQPLRRTGHEELA